MNENSTAIKTNFLRQTAETIYQEALQDDRLLVNPSTKTLRELTKYDATTIKARGTADAETSHGNLAFITKITSRSAKFTEVFFGDPTEEQCQIVEGVRRYLKEKKSKLVSLDKLMGIHPKHSYHCRTMVTEPYAKLIYLWDNLIFDLPESRQKNEPDQILIYLPEWGFSDDYDWGKYKGKRRILVDAENMVTYVLGSDYFGEVKKGHLRMGMYKEKLKLKAGQDGGLGVHAGGKVLRAVDAKTGQLSEKGALFFGLSGTGKTSLTVHHHWLDKDKGEGVIIRQDDFFCLNKEGQAFGTEDNAYIKTEGLEEKGQPLLYQGALDPDAVLENVYVDPVTREIDFFRYDHVFSPGNQCQNGRGIIIRTHLPQTDDKIDLEKVNFVFFITRRDTIVPPLAKLTSEQAAANFMLGESIITSAADPLRAGESVREVGTNPFIVGDEGEEGNIFFSIVKNNPEMECFLLNTGNFGSRRVVRKKFPLTDEASVKDLENFLQGRPHPDLDQKVEYEVNGEKVTLVVKNIRYEAQDGTEIIKDKAKIAELLKEKAKHPNLMVSEHALLEGEKITIQDSCTFIKELARNTITWKKDSNWGYDVPVLVPGIDMSRFDPLRYYTEEEYKTLTEDLRKERIKFLEGFEQLDPIIVDAIRKN